MARGAQFCVAGGNDCGVVMRLGGVMVNGGCGLGAQVAGFRVEIERCDAVGTARTRELDTVLDALGPVGFHLLNCSLAAGERRRRDGGAAKVMLSRVERCSCRRQPPSLARLGRKAPLHGSSSFLLHEAVVFFQHLAQAIVRESNRRVAVDAGHGIGGDHRVHYSFFGGLNGGEEN